jgi:ElaB/YqjD/DUF883 family membrane-anchored ribosome-binding protein
MNCLVKTIWREFKMANQHSDELKNKQKAAEKSEAAECHECHHAKGSDMLREAMEEIKERSDDVKTLVVEYVRDKPFKALGIALATGMALTFFLKR